MPTTVTQLRRAQVTDLIAQYSIDATVVDRGDLPDAGVFILEIVDDADPKDDLLARVATVADFETYGLSRTSAVKAGVGYFRSATVTKYYSDVETAIAAKDFLKEKVNDLATAYDAYLNLFKADGTGGYPIDSDDYPQTGVGLLTPAITAYTDKVTERTAQQALVTSKTATCATLTAEYTAATTLASSAQTTLDALSNAELAMNAAATAVSTFRSRADFLGADVERALTVWNDNRTLMSPALQVGLVDEEMEDPLTGGASGRLWTEYYDAFVPAITSVDIARTTFDTEIQNLNAAIQVQTQVRDDADDAVALALTAKETCARELAEAQQVLEVLEREETVLLNAVMALCPTYVP